MEVLGGPAGGRFKATPLSIALPEKEFQKWMEEEVARKTRAKSKDVPETSGSSTSWPHLKGLTFNDLTGQGKEWVGFLGFKSGLQLSYGVANSIAEARKRLDENLSRFVVNYLRTIAVLSGCLLCERPESVVGIVVILAVMDWFSQFTAKTNLDKQGLLFNVLSIFVTMFMWYIVFLSKAVASVTRALVLTLAVVLLHAAFRLTEDLENESIKQKKRKKN